LEGLYAFREETCLVFADDVPLRGLAGVDRWFRGLSGNVPMRGLVVLDGIRLKMLEPVAGNNLTTDY